MCQGGSRILSSVPLIYLSRFVPMSHYENACYHSLKNCPWLESTDRNCTTQKRNEKLPKVLGGKINFIPFISMTKLNLKSIDTFYVMRWCCWKNNFKQINAIDFIWTKNDSWPRGRSTQLLGQTVFINKQTKRKKEKRSLRKQLCWLYHPTLFALFGHEMIS